MITGKIFLRVGLAFAILVSNPGWGKRAIIPATAAVDKVLYVKPGASRDCSSWEAACDLVQALKTSVTGNEIWAASGAYYPGPPGDRLATFQLRDGVAVYGGFAGNEGAWEERHWKVNTTILSGDLDRDGNDEFDDGNAYHVVTSGGAGSTTILDGFTIQGGNANGVPPHDSGGGMYNSGSNPTLANLTFSLNYADYGGGMFNDESDPTLTQLYFTGNSARRSGGGMFNDVSSPTLIRVVFSGNFAFYDSGGGMTNIRSNPILKQVAFTNNSADVGGGIYNNESFIKLDESIFSGNSALSGGGISNHRSSNTITNVTFSSNGAVGSGGGGGINNFFSAISLTNVTFTGNGSRAITSYWWSNTTITNSILWGNPEGEIFLDENSNLTINYSIFPTHSIFPDGYDGEGNLSQDPLLGQLADNGGFTQIHALPIGSPAIDAGNPDSCPEIDQRGLPRPVDGDRDGQARCDLGAYEVQLGLYLPIASKDP